MNKKQVLKDVLKLTAIYFAIAAATSLIEHFYGRGAGLWFLIGMIAGPVFYDLWSRIGRRDAA